MMWTVSFSLFFSKNLGTREMLKLQQEWCGQFSVVCKQTGIYTFGIISGDLKKSIQTAKATEN